MQPRLRIILLSLKPEMLRQRLLLFLRRVRHLDAPRPAPRRQVDRPHQPRILARHLLRRAQVVGVDMIDPRPDLGRLVLRIQLLPHFFLQGLFFRPRQRHPAVIQRQGIAQAAPGCVLAQLRQPVLVRVVRPVPGCRVQPVEFGTVREWPCRLRDALPVVVDDLRQRHETVYLGDVVNHSELIFSRGVVFRQQLVAAPKIPDRFARCFAGGSERFLVAFLRRALDQIKDNGFPSTSEPDKPSGSSHLVGLGAY